MTGEAMDRGRRSRLPSRAAADELAEAVEALDQAQAALVDTLHRYGLGQTLPGEIWRARHELDVAYRSLQATLLALTRDGPVE